jgi:drug/metabolite transporter (DMT)-like permease
MTAHAAQDRTAIWVGLAILYGVWGSTYLAIAVAVETIPPFLMASLRFGLAGFLLLGWVAWRHREELSMPSRRELIDTTIVGALLLGGGMGLVAWGEQTIPSGITALVVATMPVWVSVLARVVLGERLPRLAGLGIVVGFVGVAILVGPTAMGQTGALDGAGLVAILVAPVAWSCGSLFATSRAVLPRHPLVATGQQMLAGAVVLALMAGVTGEPARFDPTAISPESLAAFLYLAIVGSVVAFTTFGWMIRVAPLPLVTTYAYVNPVVAVILGAIVLREPIEPRTLVAGAVIVGAVAIIVTARGRMAAPRRAATTGAGAVRAASAARADPADVAPPPAPSEPRAAPRPTRSASG